MNMKIAVFLDVTPYSLVEVFGYFTEFYCLHLRGRISVSDHEFVLIFYTDLHPRRHFLQLSP